MNIIPGPLLEHHNETYKFINQGDNNSSLIFHEETDNKCVKEVLFIGFSPFESRYNIQSIELYVNTYQLQCRYWNNLREQWITDGCWVIIQ